MVSSMIARVASGSAVAVAKQAPVARTLSTAAAAAATTATATSEESYSYVRARLAYRAEVKVMRLQFIDEVVKRKEQQARDAEAQRLKIMKEKAARMEIKRQKQAIRAAEVAREKAIHDEKVRQYFEEKVLVRQEHHAEVDKRRQALVETLQEQSESWITADNMDTKLKEDVFVYASVQPWARAAFDPSSASGSALSWLEKLQRMKPAGFKEEDADSDDFEGEAAEGTPEKDE